MNQGWATHRVADAAAAEGTELDINVFHASR